MCKLVAAERCEPPPTSKPIPLSSPASGAVGCVRAVAPDVDDHPRGRVVEGAADGCRKPWLVGPTQRPRVTRCTARTAVPKVEATVLEALLRHLPAAAHDLRADAATDGDPAERLAGDLGRPECS